MRWPWKSEFAASDDASPGGPPLDAPEDPLLVRVWLHKSSEGVLFVHPSTVFDLQRKMMEGPAAGTFCDQYELTLRRLMERTAK
jgi:hypothetical protein